MEYAHLARAAFDAVRSRIEMLSPTQGCSAAVVLLIIVILREVVKRNGPIIRMGLQLVRDLIRSRTGSLGHCLLGRLWSRTHIAPKLTKVTMPRVGEVAVVRTGKHTGERLTVLPPLKLEPGAAARDDAVVVLEPNVRFQKCLGFGGSFTESAAKMFKKMSEPSQKQIVDAYFNPDTGIGYTFGRVHMNSCDFSDGYWACAEKAGDEKLDSFTIDRYNLAILPMMRQAVAAAGRPLSLIYSPWSPPGWMKDNGNMHGGKLLPKCAKAWAQYYVRFAEEFAAAGMPCWGLTVQNEPDANTPWETCSYSAEEERDFVRDYLGPALEAAKWKGMDLKLLIWDHNRDLMFRRAQAIYADPEAAKYVWGTGYHWYGDPRYEFWPDKDGQVLWDNVQRVHELRPDKHIIMTECCQEMGPRIGAWTLGERYAEAIIKDLNNWLEAWIDWNLVLDAWGGPNHCGNQCSAPIIADTGTDRVLFLSSYYYIGHFSRYIQPGAERIAVASNRDQLEVTAFANPDGSLVAVVMNQSTRPCDFWLQVSGSAVKTVAPARSITTFQVGPSLSAAGVFDFAEKAESGTCWSR